MIRQNWFRYRYDTMNKCCTVCGGPLTKGVCLKCSWEQGVHTETIDAMTLEEMYAQPECPVCQAPWRGSNSMRIWDPAAMSKVVCRACGEEWSIILNFAEGAD